MCYGAIGNCPAKVTLDVCYEYGITNDLIYNPLKSVCMVFKPRRFKLYCPTVAIGDECLKYVDTFKYLGFVFSENKKDDADMLRQLRSLYAKANRITRMFHYCTVDVKLLLIKSYCTSFYCGYLRSDYKASTLSKLRVAFNNVYIDGCLVCHCGPVLVGCMLRIT